MVIILRRYLLFPPVDEVRREQKMYVIEFYDFQVELLDFLRHPWGPSLIRPPLDYLMYGFHSRPRLCGCQLSACVERMENEARLIRYHMLRPFLESCF